MLLLYVCDVTIIFYDFFFLMKVDANQCNSSQVPVLATTQTQYFVHVQIWFVILKHFFKQTCLAATSCSKGNNLKITSKLHWYIVSIEIIVKDACYK